LGWRKSLTFGDGFSLPRDQPCGAGASFSFLTSSNSLNECVSPHASQWIGSSRFSSGTRMFHVRPVFGHRSDSGIL
jgi:hypothetical protein